MRSAEVVISILAVLIVVQWLPNEVFLKIATLIKPGIRLLSTFEDKLFNPSAMAALDQFILFGDSLIQHSSSQERGFALTPGLQAEYIRRLDVVNRGFSGYNTDQALKVLPSIIPPPEYANVRLLLVFFGANDACLEGVEGGQHVPLDRFKQNLLNIVRHPSVIKHNPRIILVATPPVNEYLAEENDRTKGIFEPRRSAEHTREYARAVREVSNSANVEPYANYRPIAFLDLWDVFMKHAGWDDSQQILQGSKQASPNPFLRMLLHDGLHFTGLAYTLFHQEVMRVIQQTWPDQTPEKLPFVLPVWNDPSQWQRWALLNS